MKLALCLLMAMFLSSCDLEAERQESRRSCQDACAAIPGADRWETGPVGGSFCRCSGPVNSDPGTTAEGYCRVCGKMHTKTYP